MRERLDNRPLSSNYYAPNLSGLAEARRPVPYAIAFETAHFGADIGIVMGTKNRKPIIALIAKALSTPYDPSEYGKGVSASVSGGDPPALPGRHPEFDNSGSGMRNSRS